MHPSGVKTDQKDCKLQRIDTDFSVSIRFEISRICKLQRIDTDISVSIRFENRIIPGLQRIDTVFCVLIRVIYGETWILKQAVSVSIRDWSIDTR